MLAEYQARIEQRRAAPAEPAKKRKYRNNPVEVAGETYDSEKEYSRWRLLQQMEKAGVISDLRRQVSFELAPAVQLAGEERKKPALRYIADATYIEDGQLVVEDTKSRVTRQTAIYRAKKHLLKTVHGLDIKEV
jgi:hypothetical protein